MADKTRHDYLVCYDIRDPRRLSRVHRIVLDYALPLQYSVFFLRSSIEELDELCERLLDCIDVRKDDIRIYPLPKRPEAFFWGKPAIEPGISLLGMGMFQQFENTTGENPS